MNKKLIRIADPKQDYEELAALLSRLWLNPTSAARLRAGDATFAAGDVQQRLVAEDEAGRLVGYGLVQYEAYRQDGRFAVWVGVAPEHRQRGIGQQLYETVTQIAREEGATRLDSDVRDDCPHCLQFAQKRGFAIRRHLFESRLYLADYAAKPAEEIETRIAREGVRIFSLTETADYEATFRQLHQVNYETALEDPASTGKFPAFEPFRQRLEQADWFRPEGQILAAIGDKVVGLSAVGYFAERNAASNMMTGVLSAYRGRGIAQALKLRSTQVAKSWDVEHISTQNDAENGPMLAINRKLGYLPQPGEYRLEKILGD